MTRSTKSICNENPLILPPTTTHLNFTSLFLSFPAPSPLPLLLPTPQPLPRPCHNCNFNWFLNIFNCRAYSNYADQSSLHYGNYGNYSNFPSSYSCYDSSNSNYNNISYGYGTSDSLYNNGRFNAVAQKLSVISNFSEDLNESSIGTHV